MCHNLQRLNGWMLGRCSESCELLSNTWYSMLRPQEQRLEYNA